MTKTSNIYHLHTVHTHKETDVQELKVEHLGTSNSKSHHWDLYIYAMPCLAMGKRISYIVNLHRMASIFAIKDLFDRKRKKDK